MQQIISKWANTQTVAEVSCPRCCAVPGEYCKQPSGRQASSVHMERGFAYSAKIGREEFDRRHCFQISISGVK